MNDVAAEFLLFIDTAGFETNIIELVNQIAACFAKGHPPNEDAKSDNGVYLTTLSCCQPVKSGDVTATTTSHARHFIRITVHDALIHHLASALRPDMKSDKQAELNHSVKQLSPNQRAWFADVALRSYVLDITAFHHISHLVPSSSGDTSVEKPTMLNLQRLGFISECVLCHDKSVLRTMKKHYLNFQSNWFPDIDSLRSYFGDSVGFYFAWMKTYCLFLLGPTLAGLLCYVLATVIHHFSDTPSTIDRDLSSSSLISVRLLFTLFMIFWSLVCTKLWSRLHAELVECWSQNALLENTANDLAWLFSKLEERAEFRGEKHTNRITGQMELHFPKRKRRLRYLCSTLVIVVCLLMAGFVHVLLLNLEGYVTEQRSPSFFFACIGRFSAAGALFDPNSSSYWSYLPGIMHSLLIFFLNQIIFYQIALVLTKFENHQISKDFDRALVIKRFLFEMADAYACLAYLGFILSDREALRSLLLTMLCTDAVRRFLLECAVPWLIYFFRSQVKKRKNVRHKRDDDDGVGNYDDSSSFPERKTLWEKHKRELFAESYEPFDDYLEMVLQHGYLVLFAYVCPFRGALVALISTFIEAHTDAFKMRRITRRPPPNLLFRGSFVWLALLAAQSWLSVLSNVGLFVSSLIMINTEFEPFSPSLLFVLLEHALILIGLGVHFFVDDVSVTVRASRKARELKGRKLWGF